MEKVFCLVSVILVSGLVGVDSLQCYQCSNCTKPTEADLKTCGSLETTVAPTTQAPTTQGPTTQGPTTQGPQTQAPTTQSPQTQAPTTQSPQTQAPTTQSPQTQAPTTQSPQTQAPTTQAQRGPGSRSKRSILSGSDSEGCHCRNEPGCECDGLFVSRTAQYADVSYVCYKVTVDVNNETITERGCVPATVDGKAPCELVQNLTKTCDTCSTDKCNGSYTVQYSIAMLVATIAFMSFK